MSAPDGPGLRGSLWLAGDGLLRGYAVDDRSPAARIVVEILADGEPVALLRADQGLKIPDTVDVGDGCHGFAVRLDGALVAAARRIVARVANREEIVGAIDLDDPRGADVEPLPNAVAWMGGTRLAGHVRRERDGDPPPTVRALIEGREVARTACQGWVELAGGGIARRFALDLPADLADGHARAVEVLVESGEPLVGSPCLAVAFPDPLADWIDGWADLESEKLRARFADGLLPRTLPFSEIEGWLERFRLPALAGGDGRPVAVVVVGTEGVEATLASLALQAEPPARTVILPSAGSPVGFDPRRLQDALLGEAADCALVVMAVAGTRFEPGALAHLADAAARYPRAAAFYPDLLVAGGGGRRWPAALPDFDPELWLESGYCGLLYAMRRADLFTAPIAVPTLFGLFPGSAHRPRDTWPVHLPFPLATVPAVPPADLVEALAAASRAQLAADGEAAEVDRPSGRGARSVRVRRAPRRGGVSAVVAVRDAPSALERTLACLGNGPRAGLDEVVIVDNESSDARTLDLLAAARARGSRVVRSPGWFHPARLLSLGAEAANCEHLLFIEVGIAAAEDGWLDEMKGRLAGPGAAAVGALVSWESGVVRDAGYALGPRCAPAPRFVDRMADDPGYGGLLDAAHGCSALSAACLLTPRDLFLSLGSFDAVAFPRRLFALDYGLRAAASGGRVILTPHARMVMRGARLHRDPAILAPDRETRMLFERWAVVPGCDPFYPPWLAMDGLPYSGLAWPPAPHRVRAHGWPPPSLPPFDL